MTEIRFYHPSLRTAEQALTELLTRAVARGHKVVVRCSDENEVTRLNDALWLSPPDSFLPHGTAKDARPGQQPVFLTQDESNPAGGDTVILMPGAPISGIDAYSLSCQIVDGHKEERVAEARALWKAWKAEGHTITYWQQSEQGKWEQKG